MCRTLFLPVIWFKDNSITPDRARLIAPASSCIPPRAGPRRFAFLIPAAALPTCRFPFLGGSRVAGWLAANPRCQADGRSYFQTAARRARAAARESGCAIRWSEEWRVRSDEPRHRAGRGRFFARRWRRVRLLDADKRRWQIFLIPRALRAWAQL